MRPRQRRQRAPSQSQERSGRLSYQAIGAAQCGQRERGRTTDSSAGRRWMQTLRKLPTQAPSAKPTTSSGHPARLAGSAIMLARATGIYRLGGRQTRAGGELERVRPPRCNVGPSASYEQDKLGWPACGQLVQVQPVAKDMRFAGLVAVFTVKPATPFGHVAAPSVQFTLSDGVKPGRLVQEPLVR